MFRLIVSTCVAAAIATAVALPVRLSGQTVDAKLTTILRDLAHSVAQDAAPVASVRAGSAAQDGGGGAILMTSSVSAFWGEPGLG